MPCCAPCAALGDVESPAGPHPLERTLRSPVALLAASLGGLALLVLLVPEKRRTRAAARVKYYDYRDRGSSRARATMELPVERMQDVVFQRKR